MKKHNLLLCLFAVCFAAVTGNAQAVFQKKFGLNVESNGTSAIRTADGGYMLTGNSGGANSYGLGRIVLIKTDADCNVQWTRNYGGNLPEYVSAIVQNPDGSYVLTGTTYSYNSQPYGDAILMKVSSSGTLLWTKIFTGSDSEYGYDLLRLSDGGYVIGGLTRTGTAGGYDFYALRTDSAGSPLWMKKFGGIGNDEGRSLALASDGNILIFGSGYIGTNGGMLLSKLDVANGALLWTNVYGNGPGGNGSGVKLLKTNSNHYFLIGYNSGNTSSADCYVVKTDNNGTPLWSHSYGSAGGDFTYNATLTADGGIAVCGLSTGFGSGDQEMFLLRLDSAGTMQWLSAFGTAGQEQGHHVLQAYDGGFLLSGTSTTAFFSGVIDWRVIKTDAAGMSGCQQTSGAFVSYPDSLVWAAVNPTTGTPFGSSTTAFNTSLGLTDTTLCTTVGIAAVDYTGQPFTLYPNPNDGSGVSLQLNAMPGEAVQITVLNASGQLVYTHRMQNETLLEMETAGFAAGLYIVEVKTGETVSRQKLMIR